MNEFLKQLKEICDEYDDQKGRYPESEFQGEALYKFALEKILKQSCTKCPAFKACRVEKDGEYCKEYRKG